MSSPLAPAIGMIYDEDCVIINMDLIGQTASVITHRIGLAANGLAAKVSSAFLRGDLNRVGLDELGLQPIICGLEISCAV